jgi:hypothetical protein
MATLFYGPLPTVINITGGNDFLAALQVATVRRFVETGRGFALTLGGTSDDGERAVASHWLHPAIPMTFKYDAEDEYGEQPKTVIVHDDTVEALLEVMDRPLGVLWGFSQDGPYLPFADGKTGVELEQQRAAEGDTEPGD